ncbi:MAG: hypothetical protein WC506_03540 [Candidatus Micrarchaeia archaeon]
METPLFPRKTAPAGRPGQVTVEFVMIVSFLFIVLLAALSISFIYYDWAAGAKRTSESERAAKLLAAAVSHVADSGEGSSITAFVPGPENATVTFEDHSVVVTTNYTRYSFSAVTNMTQAVPANFTLNSYVRIYMLNGTVRLENVQ